MNETAARMIKKTKRLSAEARNAIGSSTVKGDLLVLPAQLDRALYAEVNKALEAFGAKWNRKRAGHVLPFPVERAKQEIFNAAETGYFAIIITDFFPTPPELAEAMAFNVCPEAVVLEPSAGEGALLVPILRRIGPKGQVLAVEQDAARESKLVLLSASTPRQPLSTFVTDFLDPVSLKRIASFGNTFGLGGFTDIIMNPPFTGKRDIDHVAAAAELLREGGVIVAVMSAGVLFRSDNKTVAFRHWLSATFKQRGASVGGWLTALKQAYGEPAFTDEGFAILPEKTFSASGTDVNTVVFCGRRDSGFKRFSTS